MSTGHTRAELAWRPLALVSGALGTVLLLLSGRYGYHRDELYFLSAGEHLAWGYPDQPPLTPLLANAMSVLSPDSLVVLRLPSTLSAAVVSLLAGVIARELGATRRGQVLAATATALCGVVLATGHLLSTATTGLLGWTVMSWLLVRVLMRPRRREWLLLGVTAGVTMQANVLAASLLLALLFAFCLVGPRDVLRSRWPWIGALVAVAIMSPYLLWQAQHGWPQLDVARDISSGGSGTSEPRVLFLPMQALMTGPWLTPVWIAGLLALMRDVRLRCLGVTYLLLCLLFLVAGGKPYYVAGLYPLLLAAGSQPVLDWVRRGWLVPAALTLSVPTVLVVLPVVPPDRALVGVNYDAGETIGWPEYVAQIATLYSRQPAGTVVLTANYGEAGAVNRYGPALGVPQAFSGHNGFGLWGPPPADTSRVLAVGFDAATLAEAFLDVQPAGRLESRFDINNDERGAPLYVCAVPRRPWSELWPTFTRV